MPGHSSPKGSGAIMTERTWQAKWIWGGLEASPRNEWRCFRRSFDHPAAEKETTLHISADSRYVLYVNGALAGRGPVRSWPEEQSYDSYDIGRLLKPGCRNTIAVLVLHFGISNFCYLRGQGGLIAELETPRGISLPTGEDWETALLGGQLPSSPRMSCQQAFAEVIDAGGQDEGWMTGASRLMAWSPAAPVCAAGEGPWKKLVSRDIPFLTEEKRYPARIAGLSRVKPPAFMAAIDLRTIMVPDSVGHANPVSYCGFLASVLQLEDKGRVTIGFPGGARPGGILVDGVPIDAHRGVQPERYYDLELAAGPHTLLIDVTSGDHGSSFHLGVDAEVPFALAAPAQASGGEPYPASDTGLAEMTSRPAPFAAIGPFDAVKHVDHQEGRELDTDHLLYTRLKEGKVSMDDPDLKGWLRGIDPRLITRQDAFGLSVWHREHERLAVPASLQNAVLPVPEPAELPLFPGWDCELVIDLGEQRSGYIGFELDAAAGTVVDIYGIEHMHHDFRQHTYGLDNTLRYICREGRQSYLSPVRRGCRYLILTIRAAARPVLLQEIHFHQSSYPAADNGSFRCSDALLNEIWSISRRTTRLCMEDTFVDCPSYEQVFWVGDARNEALVNYYVFGATEIVKRCLNLVPGSASETPLYLDQVPSGWSSVIPNWTFFWIIACEEFVEHTGDIEFAREILPHVRRTIEAYSSRIDRSGLLNMRGWNLLDWAPIDQPGEGIVTHQNLFMIKALRHAARLAQTAGEADTALHWKEQASSLQAAVNESLWDERQQAYLDCIHADGRRSSIFSMQTQVAAYLCEAADEERLAALEQYLVEPPAQWVQIGSPFMSFFYYEALSKLGRHELMLDDIRLHYGRMLEHGATTCWEMYPDFAENRANPDLLTRSHCHAWSAAPGYFLGASILGVRKLAAGWRSVEIAPQPAGLSWAEGIVPLPDGGEISVSWRVAGNSISLRVEAPSNIGIQVRWPEGHTGTVEQLTTARM